MKIHIEDKNEIERFVLLMNISLMIGLREGIVSIEEIERYVYNPYSAKKLEDIGIRDEVIKIVNLGCELEDVLSLVPDKLMDSIIDIEKQSKELLHLLPRPIPPIKKWIK